MLAAALGGAGICSVGVDKRGLFGSAKYGLSANDVTVAAYANDAHRRIKQRVATTGKPGAWVRRDGEGTPVAAAAASRAIASAACCARSAPDETPLL